MESTHRFLWIPYRRNKPCSLLVELLVLLRNQEGCVFLPRQACYTSAFVHSPRTQISLCSWFLAAQPSLAFLLGKVLQIFVLGLEFFTWHSPKQLLQGPFIDAQPHIHDVKIFGLTYSVALLLLWGLSFCICCFLNQNSWAFKYACAQPEKKIRKVSYRLS